MSVTQATSPSRPRTTGAKSPVNVAAAQQLPASPPSKFEGDHFNPFAKLEKATNTWDNVNTGIMGAFGTLALSQVPTILKTRGLGLAVTFGALGALCVAGALDKLTGSHLLKWVGNKTGLAQGLGDAMLPKKLKQEQAELRRDIQRGIDEGRKNDYWQK